jgi:hypothetical protein
MIDLISQRIRDRRYFKKVKEKCIYNLQNSIDFCKNKIETLEKMRTEKNSENTDLNIKLTRSGLDWDLEQLKKYLNKT